MGGSKLAFETLGYSLMLSTEDSSYDHRCSFLNKKEFPEVFSSCERGFL